MAQATGQDQTLIYRRTTKEDILDFYPFPSCYTATYRLPIEVMDSVLGFCGKFYPILEVSVVNSPSKKLCYGLDELDEFIKNNFKEEQYKSFLSKGYNRNHWRYYRKGYWPWMISRETFVKYYDNVKQASTKCKDMFEEAPVFHVKRDGHKTKIVYNPFLKPLEFVRIMDPYTAYQEIAMFLGNQAEPRKPIPEISDETMLEVKGFDKYSFRKSPKE